MPHMALHELPAGSLITLTDVTGLFHPMQRRTQQSVLHANSQQPSPHYSICDPLSSVLGSLHCSKQFILVQHLLRDAPALTCTDLRYTSESRAALSAAALKGADAARAGVAMAAAAQSGIELALVKMTRREEGEAHDTYGEDDDEEEEDEDEEEEEEGDYDEDDSAAAAACGGGRGGGKRGREYPASSGSDHGIEVRSHQQQQQQLVV